MSELLPADEFGDGRNEGGGLDGFGEVLAEAGGKGSFDVLFARERAESSSGDVCAARMGAHAAHEFVAVEMRHADVADDHVRSGFFEYGEGVGDVAADVHFGAVTAEDALHEAG